MNQVTIKDFMQNERKRSEEYMDLPTIKAKLIKKGFDSKQVCRLGEILRKLAFFNIIEIKLGGNIWENKPVYRAKKQT